LPYTENIRCSVTLISPDYVILSYAPQIQQSSKDTDLNNPLRWRRLSCVSPSASFNVKAAKAARATNAAVGTAAIALSISVITVLL
jgi:hypothetical protein